MGAFVVFEGGEGGGKTTQARILYRRLSREGYAVVLTREPGGTLPGESVRRLLKTRPGITPLTELLLFSAARTQLVETVILSSLESHSTVICDRFTASTVAYQGYGRGLDLSLIARLNDATTHGLRARLTVLLDLPVEVGLARKGTGSPDTFEAESVEFHRRVREGYLALAAQEAADWLVVDATLGRRTQAEMIWSRLEPLL